MHTSIDRSPSHVKEKRSAASSGPPTLRSDGDGDGEQGKRGDKNNPAQHRSGTSEARGHDILLSLCLGEPAAAASRGQNGEWTPALQYTCLGRRTIPGSALVPVRSIHLFFDPVLGTI